MMQAQDVVAAYLDAFYGGDFDRAGDLLAEGFSFRGPFVEVDGRDAFLASAEGLKRIVRGASVRRQLQHGDDVCTLFDLHLETPAGAGSIPMTEWHRVAGGRLESGVVLFDTVRFRALLEGAGAKP